MYCDSDFAGDKALRRSRTGLFIFLNSALIQWLSKKQTTVETSVFGAEFVAMKTGVDILRGIRYKLRMMGVPISGPTHIVITCPLFTTLRGQRLCLRSKATPYVTMLFKNQ